MYNESLWSIFKDKAEAVGSEVHRFSEKRLAFNFIKEILSDQAASGLFQAVANKSAFWKDFEDEARLLNIDFTPTKRSASSAETGISEADFAIADTGTLVFDATSAESRIVSTLPPLHIVILAADSILPDMPELFRIVSPQKMKYISFITGPSRTADIERVLTIGVHGPKRVIIAAVDDMSGVNS